MLSKSKLEEILKKSPPKSANSSLTLQEQWDEFLEFTITKGYEKDHALQVAKENAESLSLKMPKDTTFRTWWSTKSGKIKADSKKLLAAAAVSTAGKESVNEPIPEKIRQRIREEMESEGWVRMGAGLTIFLKPSDEEGFTFQVWVGRGLPETEQGKWVIQSFEKWNDPKDGDPTPS